MNIFILDTNPMTCARMHCDKHVVKMILESAQMICTTHHLYPSGSYDIPYRIAHKNHPCTKWVRESMSNYNWLVNMVGHLNDEYKYRYNHTKNHKSYDVVLSLPPPDLSDIGLTPFVMAMPDEYKSDDPVFSYKLYYNMYKAELLKYTKRIPPACFPSATVKVGGKEMNAYNVSSPNIGEKVMLR